MEAWLFWLSIIIIGVIGFILAFLLLGSLFPNAYDLATARNSCNSLCSQAKLATTTSAWSSSSYCKDTFDIDLDKDGDLGGCDISSGSPGNPLEDEICTGGTYNKVGQMEVDLTCYNSDIDVSCSTTIGGDPASEATC